MINWVEITSVAWLPEDDFINHFAADVDDVDRIDAPRPGLGR